MSHALIFITTLLQACCLLMARFAGAASATHPCQRACQPGAEPLTCRYEFALEMYASMGTECRDCPFNAADCSRPGCVPAEGRKKALYVVNRQLPGPTIEVCKGDRIIVNLKNQLPTETTSIHWHGLQLTTSPFMDGVPYVTQCPILPGAEFRYDFIANQTGTFVWHSHSNDQRGEGMFGSLIVRRPKNEDPVGQLYDRDEHVLILNDWTRLLGSEVFALSSHAANTVQPHTILVNGKGRYLPLKSKNGTEKHMPTAVFEVEKDKRYRFRIINVGAQNCPIEMSIDNHTMHVISSDGRDFEAIEVDSLRILSGERYDIILSANQEIDNFWIRVRSKAGNSGVSACAVTKAHQVSVLRYKGARHIEPKSKVGYDIPPGEYLRQLNPFNKGTETPDAITIPTLNSLEPDDVTSKDVPDHKFYIAYDYYNLDERKYLKNLDVPQLGKPKTMWQLNHINFKLPAFPLLTQPDMIKPGLFCNADTVKNCLKEYCSCTHMLSSRLDSVVELIIVDEGTLNINHPIHLHGYQFRVVAMEKINGTITVEEVKKMDQEGKILRKLNSAPLKDTIAVPSGGYVVVRIHANNPGYWLMHCHFEMHSDVGMALVLKVGEHEDFVKPPKNFPKCGIYKPDFRRP